MSDLTLTLHQTIGEIAAPAWDACAGADNPFVSHAFLSAVEDSGSANARTGSAANGLEGRGGGRADVCQIA